MVYSSSIATAESSRYTGSNPGWYLARLAVSWSGALAGAVGVFLVPAGWWRKTAPWLFVVGVALLALVLIPGFGREVTGARRWLDLPVVSVQPSEMVKLAAVIYAADYTARKHAVMKSFRKGLLPMLAVMLLRLWPVRREAGFGAPVVVAGTGLAILFLRGLKGRSIRALWRRRQAESPRLRGSAVSLVP